MRKKLYIALGSNEGYERPRVTALASFVQQVSRGRTYSQLYSLGV